jgi:hypothetical protein
VHLNNPRKAGSEQDSKCAVLNIPGQGESSNRNHFLNKEGRRLHKLTGGLNRILIEKLNFSGEN